MAAFCYLPNTSYRLGEKVPFDGQAKTLGDNRQVVETFQNLQENVRGVGAALVRTAIALAPTPKRSEHVAA